MTWFIINTIEEIKMAEDKKEEVIKVEVQKEKVNKEAYELSIAGFKLKLNSAMLAMAIPIATTCGGALWGGFVFYQDYLNMKKKIETYVTPDLTAFDKRLTVIEETGQKTNDYTRDIKNDIKEDIRKLERIVEQVERSTKQNQREIDQDVRQLRKEMDSKIQKALDNPLAK
jgi:hypothetical protein